jgi:hypothetical protein
LQQTASEVRIDISGQEIFMFVITLMTSGLQTRKLGATRCCKTFANEQACFTSEEIFLYSFLFATEFLSMSTDRHNVPLSCSQDLKCNHVVLHVKEKSLYDSCCSCGGDSSYGVMGHWPAACSAPEQQRFTFT